MFNVRQSRRWGCVSTSIFITAAHKCKGRYECIDTGNRFFIDAYTQSPDKKGPDSHMHTVLCETTQPPYWDPFHLSLLTTVVSCGLIGPHQTASLTSSVITRNPPSLAHCLLSFSHSIPTHQHHTHVCLSLAFISPAYWTPPLASEWSFDGTAPQHKSIFAPFTYYHANKWFVMSVLGAYNGKYRLCTLQALLMGPYGL